MKSRLHTLRDSESTERLSLLADSTNIRKLKLFEPSIRTLEHKLSHFCFAIALQSFAHKCACFLIYDTSQLQQWRLQNPTPSR